MRREKITKTLREKKILVLDIEADNLESELGSILEIGIVGVNLETGEKKIIYNELVFEGVRTVDPKAWIFENSDMKYSDIASADELDVKYLQFLFDNYAVTAYNKAYDFKWLRSRGLIIHDLPCPMILSTPICKMPYPSGKKGYKWPKVPEAYEFFFGETGYIEQHRGADDAMHEADIVIELYKRGIFKL